MKSKKKSIHISAIICVLLLCGILLISLLLQSKEEPEEILTVIAGYYWSGLIDERERLGKEEEADYRKDYLTITDANQRVFDARYIWVEVGAVSANHVENGDYVQVYFTGPILERYPGKVQGVVRIEVIPE